MLRRFSFLLIATVLLLSGIAAAEDDAVRVFEDLTIGPNDRVGDVMIIGGRLNVQGRITGDVAMFGGTLKLEGSVHGDVAKFGGETALGPQSQIDGQLTQLGGELDRAPSALVKGELTYKPLHGIFLALAIGSVIAAIPIGILLALLGYAILRPQRVHVMAEAMQHTGSILLTGFIAAVITVLLFVFSVKIGIVHVPFRGILAAFFCVTLFVGYTGVSAWIGRRISQQGTVLAVTVVGAAVVALLQAIPLVGLVALVFFNLAALGTAISTGFGTNSGWLRSVL